MTMSVWSESMMASIKGFLTTQPNYVGLPRVLVNAAIQESARHPTIKTLPRLKTTMESHRQVLAAFRDAHVTWSLDHMDLIGGLHTEGAYVWDFWAARVNATQAELTALKNKQCVLTTSTRSCVATEQQIAAVTKRLTEEQMAETAWVATLEFNLAWSAEQWWKATQKNVSNGSFDFSIPLDFSISLDSFNSFNSFESFYKRLQNLHNVTEVYDDRVLDMIESIRQFTCADPWIRRFLHSLLEGDIWAATLEHVRKREARVRDLMIAAGVQELTMAHERALAASLKSLPDLDNKKKLVEDWFGEMASYAWWLPDEVAGIIRRCIGQEGGDCSRIGPTEIQTLMVQYVERNRILEDWTRRLFIGMWNAMPIIGILFILEIIVLVLPQKRIVSIVDDTRVQRSPMLISN